MKPLLKLLAENRGRGQFRAEASQDEATIYLYDTIVSDAETAAYFGGVDPLTFAKALSGISAPVIHLRINSPGGDVFAAQAMAQALREHPAKVIAHIDGYAASAATEVATAADTVIMAPGAMYMIHNAWTIAIGNKDDFIDVASLLEKVDGALAAAYAARTGADIQQVTDWMNAETWFTAQEAVDAGFADSVAESKTKATASTKWNLSAYAHAPITISNVSAVTLNDAETVFVSAMIEHHQMALDMADGVYPDVESSEIKNLVEDIISTQSGEIALMSRWLDNDSAMAKNKQLIKMQTNTDHLKRRLELVKRTA